MTATVDQRELEAKVMAMYTAVANEPDGTYHFEMGRGLAERLGYPTSQLDRVPEPAVQSFAGVGYYFDLAALKPGERVIDLGSGSGMDAFIATALVGESGWVDGVDMTDAQLAKSTELAVEADVANVKFTKARIEELPYPDGTFDCLVSNGVINLAPDKAQVFREAARVLKPGGRIALADIITDAPLKESIVCNTDLWASCIGGASFVDAYRADIEAAGFEIRTLRDNPYKFISQQAVNASAKYGVRSVSLLASR